MSSLTSSSDTWQLERTQRPSDAATHPHSPTVNPLSWWPGEVCNCCHCWCAHVVATLWSKGRPRRMTPLHLSPSFNQNSGRCHFEKMSATCHVSCVGPLLLPPAVLSLVIYSFLPPFSVQETYIGHLSTSIQESHKEIVCTLEQANARCKQGIISLHSY